ncbi:MAG: outer membrane protein assembly factor BamE [Pseudomonadota bacterium]
MSKFRSGVSRRAFVGLAGVSLLAVGGCTSRVRFHGFVVSREALAQVPVGSSQEQVLLSLGTPSTTSTIGGETFYYISSRIEERAFFRPKVTERRVLAVKFAEDQTVTRISEYGLEDGRVVDFVNRNTPTRGSEINLIRQILSNAGQGSPIGGPPSADAL